MCSLPHASVLLTFNLADFPNASLAAYGIVARDPDDFLCEMHASDPEAVEAAVDVARRNLRITTPDMSEFIDILERQRLVTFAACLRK